MKKITALYNGETKRCYRFKIRSEAETGLFGSIYVSKDADIPDKIIVIFN